MKIIRLTIALLILAAANGQAEQPATWAEVKQQAIGVATGVAAKKAVGPSVSVANASGLVRFHDLFLPFLDVEGQFTQVCTFNARETSNGVQGQFQWVLQDRAEGFVDFFPDDEVVDFIIDEKDHETIRGTIDDLQIDGNRAYVSGVVTRALLDFNDLGGTPEDFDITGFVFVAVAIDGDPDVATCAIWSPGKLEFERESHDLSSEATPLDAVVAHFGHRLDNPFFIDLWSVPHGRVKVSP